MENQYFLQSDIEESDPKLRLIRHSCLVYIYAGGQNSAPKSWPCFAEKAGKLRFCA